MWWCRKLFLFFFICIYIYLYIYKRTSLWVPLCAALYRFDDLDIEKYILFYTHRRLFICENCFMFLRYLANDDGYGTYGNGNNNERDDNHMLHVHSTCVIACRRQVVLKKDFQHFKICKFCRIYFAVIRKVNSVMRCTFRDPVLAPLLQ